VRISGASGATCKCQLRPPKLHVSEDSEWQC
jgi:hypothetical protein